MIYNKKGVEKVLALHTLPSYPGIHLKGIRLKSEDIFRGTEKCLLISKFKSFPGEKFYAQGFTSFLYSVPSHRRGK